MSDVIDLRGNRAAVRYLAAELSAQIAARPADAPCVWCEGSGEIWISGDWVPCYCDSVRAVNLRLRERVAELEAERADTEEDES